MLSAAVSLVAAFSLFGCGVPATPDISPHLPATPDPTHRAIALDWESAVFPPAGAGNEAYRERVDLLYSTVVYDGKFPLLDETDPVYPVLSGALDILDGIILSEWQHDGFSVVHAIHDYLAYNVDYDFSLYDSYKGGNTDVADDPAFYMDGVFLDRLAVCDGIARAFDFLCALEGVESMRVTGSYASAPHAWNKVKVDGDWYNVDVTADCANYNIKNKLCKQISHGYFLLSDETISSFRPTPHVFSDQPVTADRDRDFFESDCSTVKIGGKVYPTVVTNAGRLNEIFTAISDADGSIGKIELKLDFAGKTQVNLADMYATEIASAYGCVDNCSFSFASGNKPYFRYPNGVYLFLIYE